MAGPPGKHHGPISCPKCSALAGTLRAVGTVAQQPEDYKLTYQCSECEHEWAVEKPAHWITRLGEDVDDLK
jgi:hypothetical protein